MTASKSASKSDTVVLPHLSAIDYVKLARELRGIAPASSVNGRLAVTFGKTVAGFRNGFTIARAVYTAERAPFKL
jgi:hypothetical protein